MKEKIEFKKSVLFKTSISEITDINVTHDYKIKDDTIEGEFSVSGLYKMTVASVNETEFFYNIPFVIALSDRIKKESINLTLYDFNYEIMKDTLNIKMMLNMEYEENEMLTDDTEPLNESELESVINEMITDEEVSENADTIKESEEEKTIETNIEKENITSSDISNIITNFKMDKEYVTYKVHITRQDDTIESIASKYEVSIDEIKMYNDIDVLSIGDKIIIPEKKHE